MLVSLWYDDYGKDDIIFHYFKYHVFFVYKEYIFFLKKAHAFLSQNNVIILSILHVSIGWVDNNSLSPRLTFCGTFFKYSSYGSAIKLRVSMADSVQYTIDYLSTTIYEFLSVMY